MNQEALLGGGGAVPHSSFLAVQPLNEPSFVGSSGLETVKGVLLLISFEICDCFRRRRLFAKWWHIDYIDLYYSFARGILLSDSGTANGAIFI